MHLVKGAAGEGMQAAPSSFRLGLGTEKTTPANPCPDGSYHMSRRWLGKGDRGSSEQSSDDELEGRSGPLTHRLQSLDSGELRKVFGRGAPWPDLSAMPY